MNHYPHHIGDWITATAHLSEVEECIYARLIALYYSKEGPIPAAEAQACRLVRASSKEARNAVGTILREFFTLHDDGWHQKRCDQEIEAYKAKADANRVNGKKGGRPKANTKRTHSEIEPTNNPTGFSSLTQNNLNQNQNQNQKSNAITESPTRTDGQAAPQKPESKPENPPTKAGIWSAELNLRGVRVTPMHPTLLQWIEDGFTLPQLLDAIQDARQKKPAPEPLPANYLDPILRNPPKRAQPVWWASDAGIEAKGRELNLTPRPGEGWPQFKDRINAKLAEQRAA